MSLSRYRYCSVLFTVRKFCRSDLRACKCPGRLGNKCFKISLIMVSGRVVLLGDSILKHLEEVPGLVNKCIRGATISSLCDYVTFMQKHEREALNPSILLVHIGTNDLQPGITVSGFIDKYEILIALLKWFFPSCPIFCSAMLPRPRDYCLTRFISKSCNEALGIVADRNGCSYMQTFKPFMAEGRPRSYLLSAIDKLHVNGLGLTVLASFFRRCLGPRNQTLLREMTHREALKASNKFARRGYPKV